MDLKQINITNQPQINILNLKYLRTFKINIMKITQNMDPEILSSIKSQILFLKIINQSLKVINKNLKHNLNNIKISPIHS